MDPLVLLNVDFLNLQFLDSEVLDSHVSESKPLDFHYLAHFSERGGVVLALLLARPQPGWAGLGGGLRRLLGGRSVSPISPFILAWAHKTSLGLAHSDFAEGQG